MADGGAFDEIDEAKVNLDHIYDRPDPRAYLRELSKVGYAIPGAVHIADST